MEEDGVAISAEEKGRKVPKVAQEQIHDLLLSEQLSWQSIIYDLINTEQLDPWDIDITVLTQKYFERIHELEEENFFISSKVLLAAALLLRMKSEMLLQYTLPSLDAILFGTKEEKKYVQEHIVMDEEVPELMVRTPLPRTKKVTLEELMQALGKAISTENRRIKKIALTRQQEFEMAAALPKRRLHLKEEIEQVYRRLKEIFSGREEKLAFSELATTPEDKILTFIPLLYLDTQHRIWLEQERHCEEIWVLLKQMYEKQNATELERMRLEVEAEMKALNAEEQQRAEEGEEFERLLGEDVS